MSSLRASETIWRDHEISVPELTGSANIKLNVRQSLRMVQTELPAWAARPMIWKTGTLYVVPNTSPANCDRRLIDVWRGTLPGKSALVRCRLASYLQRMRYPDNTTPRHDECSRFQKREHESRGDPTPQLRD
jgi:hypothetical protein